MGIEKAGSNYAGLISDWNAKSRKKLLFSRQPGNGVNQNQNKQIRSSPNCPTTPRLQIMDEDEVHRCGVVARLMGLDSMPKLSTSSTTTPSSHTVMEAAPRINHSQSQSPESRRKIAKKTCQKRTPLGILKDESSKATSISLALQAKANVKKRQALSTTTHNQNSTNAHSRRHTAGGASKSPSRNPNSQHLSQTTPKKRSVEDGINQKNMDVISFTFSAPMRSYGHSSPSKRKMLNAKGGDAALSPYLEQQLPELAHKLHKNHKIQGMCRRHILGDRTSLSFRFSSPVSFLESSHSSDRDCAETQSWEVDYVTKMLMQCNMEQRLNDYAMGRSRIINHNLFNQLERCFNDSGRTSRRLVFDCASECLDRLYKKHGAGVPTLWVKGVRMVKHKDRLVKDVCKEISSCSSIKDLKVDELVDRDMTMDPWLDYNIEGFENGTKIADRMLNSLLDELVADILLLRSLN